jgi:hypothetical protein
MSASMTAMLKQLVAVTELHARDAGRRPAHGTQLVVGGREPNRLALLADQQQIIRRRRRPGTDQLVVLVAEVDRDQARLARRVVRRQVRLLDQALLGGQQQVRLLLVGTDRENPRDLLVRQETHQTGDVAALGVPATLGQLPGLRPVDAAEVREEQQPVVAGGGEQVLHLVVGAQRRPAHALAAALLQPVLVGTGALGVAAVRDRDDHVLVGDEVLVGHVAVGGDDRGAPVVAVLVDDLLQLLADDRAAGARAWPGCPSGRRSGPPSRPAGR